MALPSDSEIRQLSPEQRIRLIELLWQSFVDEPDTLPVTDAQRAELRRRLAEHESNPEEAKSWTEVRSELEQE